MTREQAEAAVTVAYLKMFGEGPPPDVLAKAADELIASGQEDIGLAQITIPASNVPERVIEPLFKLANDVLVVLSSARDAAALNALTFATISLVRSFGVDLDAYIKGLRDYDAAVEQGCDRREIRRDS